VQVGRVGKQAASGTTAPEVREYFQQQAEVAGQNLSNLDVPVAFRPDRLRPDRVRVVHPIPACRIVAVTLPPALDSALVSLIAETWLNDQGRAAGGEGGADARPQHLEVPVPVLIMVVPVIERPVRDATDAVGAACSTQVRC
jgi:hypothetical protein